MPSDERIELALKALSDQTQSFRSALANTIEQIRSFQASHGSNAEGKVARLQEELGPFADDLIDADKFSALFADSLKLDTLTLDPEDPRQVSLRVINQRLRGIRHLDIRKVTAGEPRPQGQGVALVSVSLGLDSPTHEAIMQALVSLTRPGQGYTWESFDLQADVEAKRVRLSGEVLTVVVEAAEPAKDKDTPSYRNLIRLGFQDLYRRPNYIYEF